jgi:hypothetical protein
VPGLGDLAEGGAKGLGIAAIAFGGYKTYEIQKDKNKYSR